MIVRKETNPNENSFSFQIMGDDYVVKGNDKPEYMEAIVNYLESVINNIMSSNQKLNKNQVAVLAALKIADELYKLRQKYQHKEQKQPGVESQKSK